MESRFSLSVKHGFCYRSKIVCTGEIIEADTFRDLYHWTLSTLRSMVTDAWYCVGADAVLEFGYKTSYEDKPNYWFTEWTPIEKFGYLLVSPEYKAFHRISDDSTHYITE